jgi:hypothetical protein
MGTKISIIFDTAKFIFVVPDGFEPPPFGCKPKTLPLRQETIEVSVRIELTSSGYKAEIITIIRRNHLCAREESNSNRQGS